MMMTLATALKAQDSAMFFPTDYEWTEDDKRIARERLVDAIYEGKKWDEDGDYRFDMLTDIEAILLDKEDDKLGRIKDAHHAMVMKYVNDQVSINPDKYCEVDDD